MMDATTRIKNLSIAAERLSRSKHTTSYVDEILDLLADEIALHREEKKAEEAARPAEPTADHTVL